MVQKREMMWKWHSVVIFNAVCQTEANGVFETVGGLMAERVERATLHDIHNCPVQVKNKLICDFCECGGRV